MRISSYIIVVILSLMFFGGFVPPLYSEQNDNVVMENKIGAIFSRMNDTVMVVFYSRYKSAVLAMCLYHNGETFVRVKRDVDRIIIFQSREGYISFRTVRTAIGSAIVYSHIEDGLETLHGIDELPLGVFPGNGGSDFFARFDVPESVKSIFLREDIELNRLDVSILREIIESIEKESVDTEGSNSVDDMPTLNETSEVDTLPPEDHSEP